MRQGRRGLQLRIGPRQCRDVDQMASWSTQRSSDLDQRAWGPLRTAMAADHRRRVSRLPSTSRPVRPRTPPPRRVEPGAGPIVDFGLMDEHVIHSGRSGMSARDRPLGAVRRPHADRSHPGVGLHIVGRCARKVGVATVARAGQGRQLAVTPRTCATAWCADSGTTTQPADGALLPATDLHRHRRIATGRCRWSHLALWVWTTTSPTSTRRACWLPRRRRCGLVVWPRSVTSSCCSSGLGPTRASRIIRGTGCWSLPEKAPRRCRSSASVRSLWPAAPG